MVIHGIFMMSELLRHHTTWRVFASGLKAFSCIIPSAMATQHFQLLQPAELAQYVQYPAIVVYWMQWMWVMHVADVKRFCMITEVTWGYLWPVLKPGRRVRICCVSWPWQVAVPVSVNVQWPSAPDACHAHHNQPFPSTVAHSSKGMCGHNADLTQILRATVWVRPQKVRGRAGCGFQQLCVCECVCRHTLKSQPPPGTGSANMYGIYINGHIY